MFQYRSHEPQVKRNVISSVANLVYDLPSDLRLDLRKFRVIRKSQIWVQTSLIKKSNFGNSSQKTHVKKGIKLFLPCRILLDFSILFYILCPRFYFLKICNYKTFAICIQIFPRFCRTASKIAFTNCLKILLFTNPLANKTVLRYFLILLNQAQCVYRLSCENNEPKLQINTLKFQSAEISRKKLKELK